MSVLNMRLRDHGWLSSVLAGLVFLLVLSNGREALSARGPSIEVNVDSTSIYRDEELVITITASGSYDNIEMPSMEGFSVTGRFEGRSFSFGTGGSFSERTITVNAMPDRPGKLVVGPARLLINGKAVASSRPIEITVRDEDAPAVAPRGGRQDIRSIFPRIQTPRQEPVKAPRIVATIAPDPEGDQGTITAYTGQPLVLEYILLTPTPLDYWSINVSAKPTLDGFVVREAPRSQLTSEQVSMDDGTWYRTQVWKVALTPINAGELEISPLNLAAVFRGFQEYRVASDRFLLTVRDVPADAPAGFSPGVLGRFEVSAGIDNDVIAHGETTTLTIKVAGAGNLAALTAPKVIADSGIRVDAFASSQADDDITIGSDGMTGSRTFRYLLTPLKAPAQGAVDSFKVRIAPVVFFDYVSGTWNSSETDEMNLSVKGSIETRDKAAHRAPGLGIIEKSDLAQPAPSRGFWLTPRRLLALMALPILILLVISAVSLARRRRPGKRAEAKKALGRAITGVAKLERQAVADMDFWNGVDATVREYVGRKFDIQATAMTPSDIAAGLAARGVPRDVLDDLVKLLDECSLARFAGVAAGTDRGVAADAARSCLAALDRCDGGAR